MRYPIALVLTFELSHLQSFVIQRDLFSFLISLPLNPACARFKR